ncbi:MAG: DUF2993 domain-containing protein [Actinomycetales bacterium]|nr:DUF2993 domain-containing protein [Actinomycetales bacterium]
MLRRLLIALLVVVVLGAAAAGGDAAMRQRTVGVIESDLAGLGLHNPHVSIGGLVVTPQVLAGRFGRMVVTADSMLVQGLELDHVDATLTDVTTGDEPRAGTFVATAELSPAAMTAAVGADLDITVQDGALVATLRAAPLSATIVPNLRSDRIDLEVTKLTLAGVSVAPADLPLGLGDAFENMSVAVDGLPPGVVLEDVTVGQTSLELSFSGTDVALELP